MLKFYHYAFRSIIYTRSNIFKEKNIDKDALSMSKLINIIYRKITIIIDGVQILVVYKE